VTSCEYLWLAGSTCWLAVSTCDWLSEPADWLSVPVIGYEYLLIGCQYLWLAGSKILLTLLFTTHQYSTTVIVTDLYVHYMLVLSYNIQLYRNISHKIIQLSNFVVFFFLPLAYISISLCHMVILCIPPRYVTKPTRSTQPCIPLGSLNRVLALIGWGKGGNVTSAGWQVILCDPMWYASSHSGAVLVAQTAICFLPYLKTSGNNVTILTKLHSQVFRVFWKWIYISILTECT